MISQQLMDWKKGGEFISYGPLQYKLFVKQIGDSNSLPEKTLLLIHGFPESSFSYRAIVEGMLRSFDRIILCDMLGYGWSDKPTDYSYSLMEQTDTIFAVWNHFGISGGHLIAHDMGVSVATEILARHENELLPHWFSEGIKSITFTNGSLVLKLAKLRIAQKVLLSRFGALLSANTSYSILKHQVRSAHGNNNLSNEDILHLWEANTIQNGHRKTHLTIQYVNDRKRFEKTRWLPALQQTKIPIHICWGNDDAVARVEMAYYLKEYVCPNARLTIMKGVGHFGQLGNPEKWVNNVIQFYKDNT